MAARAPQLNAFEQKLNDFSAKSIHPELAASGAANYNLHFQLEPLADIHFSQGKPIYLQYTEFNTDRKWHMIFKWMIKSKD